MFAAAITAPCRTVATAARRQSRLITWTISAEVKCMMDLATQEAEVGVERLSRGGCFTPLQTRRSRAGRTAASAFRWAELAQSIRRPTRESATPTLASGG